MTDLATQDAPASTTLDTATTPDASGGGVPATLETEAKEPAKPESIHDAVAAAVKESTKPKEAPEAVKDKPDTKEGERPEKGDVKADDAKESAKDEKGAKDKAEKPERGTDGKFKAEAKPEGDAKPEHSKQVEQSIASAPKHFLPDAKEKWANTPQPVRREVETMTQNHEAEIAKYREAAERYEPIREYDDLVRQNGRKGVHETLAEVAQLEEQLQKRPLAALNAILLRSGPRKPDGSPVTLMELAQTVVQMGADKYNHAVRPAQQQQPGNDNGEVAQLKARLAQMEQQQLAASVIEPFKATHPRYAELQGDIALFLKSGKIPDSLSPQERLEAAYDMAARINPASHVENADKPEADPDPGSRAVTDLSGSKSIKSAPGAVSTDMEPERGGSIEDLLRQELRRVKAR